MIDTEQASREGHEPFCADSSLVCDTGDGALADIGT